MHTRHLRTKNGSDLTGVHGWPFVAGADNPPAGPGRPSAGSERLPPPDWVLYVKGRATCSVWLWKVARRGVRLDVGRHRRSSRGYLRRASQRAGRRLPRRLQYGFALGSSPRQRIEARENHGRGDSRVRGLCRCRCAPRLRTCLGCRGQNDALPYVRRRRDCAHRRALRRGLSREHGDVCLVFPTPTSRAENRATRGGSRHARRLRRITYWEPKGCDTTCKRQEIPWRPSAVMALEAASRSSCAGWFASAGLARSPCARWMWPQA